MPVRTKAAEPADPPPRATAAAGRMKPRAATGTTAASSRPTPAAAKRATTASTAAGNSRTVRASSSESTSNATSTTAVTRSQRSSSPTLVGPAPATRRTQTAAPASSKAGSTSAIRTTAQLKTNATASKATAGPSKAAAASTATAAAAASKAGMKAKVEAFMSKLAKPSSCTPSQTAELLSWMHIQPSEIGVKLLAPAPASAPRAKSTVESGSTDLLSDAQKTIICKQIINASLSTLQTLIADGWTPAGSAATSATARTAAGSESSSSQQQQQRARPPPAAAATVSTGNVRVLIDGFRIASRKLFRDTPVASPTETQTNNNAAPADDGESHAPPAATAEAAEVNRRKRFELLQVCLNLTKKLVALGLFEEAAVETRHLAQSLMCEEESGSNEEAEEDCALLPTLPANGQDLQRLSLLVQTQALAFNAALGLAKTERDVRAAHRLLMHPERAPFKLIEAARQVLAERSAQLDTAAAEGLSTAEGETNPQVKELKASLDRSAYSIERSVARAVEKVATATTTTTATKDHEAVFQLRHAGLQLLFFVSEVDTNAVWERVGRVGHNHMRSCYEASRAPDASPAKARSGNGKDSGASRWAQDSFPVVHKAFQDSVRSAERTGKLDVKSPGFEKLVETWTTLAQKAGDLKAFSVIEAIQSGKPASAVSTDKTLAAETTCSEPSGGSSSSASFQFVPYHNRLLKASVAIDAVLDDGPSAASADFTTTLDEARAAVLAISHRRDAQSDKDKERGWKAMNSLRLRVIFTLTETRAPKSGNHPLESPRKPFSSSAAQLSSRSAAALFQLLDATRSALLVLLKGDGWPEHVTFESLFADLGETSRAGLLHLASRPDGTIERCRAWIQPLLAAVSDDARGHAESTARREFLQTLSQAWYTVGNRLYNAKQPGDAQHFLREACEVIERAIDREAVAGQDQVQQEAISEVAIRMHEHMAICYRTLSKSQLALDMYAKALKAVRTARWQELECRYTSLAVDASSQKNSTGQAPLGEKVFAIASAITVIASFDLLLKQDGDQPMALNKLLQHTGPIARAAVLEHCAGDMNQFMHRDGCLQTRRALLDQTLALLDSEVLPMHSVRVELAQVELCIAEKNVQRSTAHLQSAEAHLSKLAADSLSHEARLLSATVALFSVLGRRWEAEPQPLRCLTGFARQACSLLYPLLGIPQSEALAPLAPNPQASNTAPKALAPVTPPRKAALLTIEDSRSSRAADATPSAAELSQIIGNANQLLFALDAARELLSAAGEGLASLGLTKAHRRLLSMLSQDGTFSDKLSQVSSDLAVQYISLGGMTRASKILLSLGTTEASSHRARNPVARFHTLIATTEQLLAQNDVQRAREQYASAVCMLHEIDVPARSAGWERCRHKVEGYERLGLAASTYSHITMAEGDLNESIAAALSAMKEMMKGIKLLERFCGWEVKQDLSEQQTATGAATLELVSVFYRLSRHMSAASHRISQLYAVRGSAKDADMFASETVDLADFLPQSFARARALIHRAGLRWKLNRMSDSSTDLDHALRLVKGLQVPETIAYALVRGDSLSQASKVDALAVLNRSQTILAALDSAFSEVDAALPSPAPLKRLSNASDIGRSVRRVSMQPPRPELLPDVRAKLLRGRAWLLHQLESDVEASKLLEEASLVEMTDEGNFEDGVIRARISLQRAISCLEKDRALKAMEDSVLCMPLVPISKASKPSAKLAECLTHLASADKSSMRLFEGGKSAPPALLQKEAGVSRILTGLLEASMGRVSLSATEVQLALSRSCNITLEREFLEALNSKRKAVVRPRESQPWLKPAPELDHAKSRTAKSLAVKHRSSSPDLESDDLPDLAVDNLSSERWTAAQARLLNKAAVPVQLPSHWTLVSVSCDRARGLLILSRQRGHDAPMTISLPIDRHSRHEGEENEATFEAVLGEIDHVVHSSNTAVHSAKDLQGMDARKAWWTERRALNDKLGAILALIEQSWLGAFRALLAQPAELSEDEVALLRARLDTKLRTACLHGSRKASRVKFQPAILDLFFDLPSDTPNEDIEDMLRFFSDAYQLNGVPIAVDEMDHDQAVVDIRPVLEEAWAKSAANRKTAAAERVQHTFLVLDKDMCAIPWESMPILRRRSVSRIPSIYFLQDRLEADLGGRRQAEDGTLRLSPTRTFYLLNPGGDLTRSQDRFLPWLKARTSWKGIAGREPIANELSEALASNDLMLYFGHSGAEQFVRPKALRQMDRCAVTMLWGCSSGILHDAGQFDRTGTPHHYMMAGAAALVCNLWDLTDRELDNVSESVFLRLGLMESEEADEVVQAKVSASAAAPTKKRVTPIGERPVSLPLAVAQARDDCRLPFLTGAACIVYGIPVEWERCER